MKNLAKLVEMKQSKEKISMITAYDFPSAKQAQEANIDMILVGDSLGMTVLGYETTTQVTLEDMIHHGKAVRRGADDTFVVVDLPIGAVGVSDEHDLKNAITLYQQTNANALKAEGAHLVDFIKKSTQIGIPIVAHLGLMPQSVGVMGYRLQGGTKDAAEQLIQEAHTVQEAGAVALVLEAIPSDLAGLISNQLDIPVIGIGAGKDTDGQVLVYHDMLNYGVDRYAKFVKQFADLSVGIEGIKQYNEEVKAGIFPAEEHTYKKKILDEVNNHDTSN